MNYQILNRTVSLDRLETFRKVVEHGSIAEAADRDSNRQSQFSRQIKELESAFEVRLFDAKGKERRLNEKGRELVLLIEQFFGALEDFWKSNTTDGITISIGAGESILEGVVLPALGEFGLTMPHVKVQMRNLRSKEVVEQLSLGSLDIGILVGPPQQESLTWSPLGKIRYHVLIPRTFLRVGVSQAFTDIVKHPWAVLAGNGRGRNLLEANLKAIHSKVHVTFEASSYAHLAEIARMGLAVVCVPEWIGKNLSADLVSSVSFEELSSMNRDFYLVSNPKNSDLRPLVAKAAHNISRILDAGF
ncbi:MAG: LysR family transcriptional regulator [Verrucomicrobia bacterium]|nr:LysR family transcriptional regulator [Verrucomicrobiota bacterium]MCH8512264.1 LysR family transcriptional regulator [Kiritimatiellia bacterium]